MNNYKKKPKNNSLNGQPLSKKVKNEELKLYGYGLDKDHPFRKLSDKPKKIDFEKKLDKGKKKDL